MALNDDDDDDVKPGARAALDRHFEEHGDDDDDDLGEDPPAEGDELPAGTERAPVDEDDDDDQPPAGDPPADPAEPPVDGDAAPQLDADGQPIATAPASGDDEDWAPMTFRAGGRLYEIEGAVVGKDGAYIPLEKLPAVLEHIQRGVHHNSTFQEELAARDRKIAEFDPELNDAVVEANAVLDFLEPHLKSQEAAEAFIANFANHRLLMTAQVDAAKAKANAAKLTKYPQLREPVAAEPTEAEFQEHASRALWAHFDDLLDRGEFRGLFQGPERKALEKEIIQRARDYITTATQDVDAGGVTIRKGEKAIDLQRLGQDIRRFAEQTGRVRPVAAGKRTAADKAAAANRAARRDGKAPKGAGGRVPPRGGPAKEPRNREEWLRSLQSDVQGLTREYNEKG